MKRITHILAFLFLVVLVHATTGDFFVSGLAQSDKAGISDAIPQDTVPLRQRMKARRSRNSNTRNYKNPMDSIRQAVAAQALQDSIPQNEAVVPDSSDVNLSLALNDSLAADTLALDTVSKKKDGLEAPVSYEAKDSVWYFMDSGTIFMYGESKVGYQNMELNAELITVNVDSTIVHAYGVSDSLGTVKGKPVFKEGGSEYQSEQMSYNFKTGKGYITNVDTQQDDGFLTAERTKKNKDNEMFLEHGRYTTCDAEHPHFYIALSRAKVRPKKDVFFGPAWLVVEDVPIPFALPFGFFPFSDSNYSSGFLMPSYGEDSNRGFYLRDGGYYFAINDHLDLKVLGEIYTKGSWGINASSNYNKRYRYRGSFSFDYQVFKTGDKNFPDYSETKSFSLRWNHSQDSKANPNSTFSANVNYSTSAYDKTSMSSLYNPTQHAQSTKTSSISYSRTFSEIGLTLSSSANVSMSSRDSTISMTLPDLNITLARFNPFKRKHAAGKERWYEKIALSYTGNLSNRINTKENLILHSNLIKDWKNGFKHTIPVTASFSLFKYINVSPSLNYTERWYTDKEIRSWDEVRGVEKRDTVYGFHRVANWNLSLSANTKIYGMYKPWKMFGDKIEMIRHVITPTLSYSYAPDFSASRYGYYDTYLKTDADGTVTAVTYSPYSSGMFGVPGAGKTGSISMGLSNNLEMKVKDEKSDSATSKKISLIDELSMNMSYNTAAQRQPWSDLSMNIRLKLTKSYTFNMNAVFATYAYELDDKGNVYVGDHTEWGYGRWGRFQGMSQHLSYTLDNQKVLNLFKKKVKEEKNNKTGDDDDDDDESLETPQTQKQGKGSSHNESAAIDDDGYMKFKMPWTLSLSYSVTMAENKTREKFNEKSMRYPYKLTHQFNLSGTLKISNAWNCSYTSGYDFTNHRLSTTTVNINRDLHCFTLSGGLVLSSYGYTSYNFTIRATSGQLADALKYDKRSAANNSVQWY